MPIYNVKQSMPMYRFSDSERQFYESLPFPLAIYQYIDGKTVTLLISDAFCEMTGKTREEQKKFLNDSMFVSVHPDDAGMLATIGEKFAGHKIPEYDVLYRLKVRNDYRLIHTIGKWRIMPDGTEVAVLIYMDMQKSQEKNNEILKSYFSFKKDLFYIDPLTQLPNLNSLNQFAGEYVAKLKLQRFSPVLVFINLRDMKNYNSEYGYEKGNALLRLIASELKFAFPDGLIVRGENDHFYVIDKSTDVIPNIERINTIIKEEAEGNTFGIQAGIAYTDEAKSLLEAIDNAKYAVAEISKNMNIQYQIFTRNIDQNYWKSRHIIENFSKALEQNWIKVFYQPIIRTKTEKICSLEALARWQENEKSVFGPGDFIPVLEKYHLLYKLDLYMVEQVCRETRKRLDLGLEVLPVSVNIAGQDFDYVNIADRVKNLADKYKLSHDLLIIEITEQTIANGTSLFQSQLELLKEYGFKVWIDDFGSGYSSLNVFSKYKFDLIKLDMELLKHLDDNKGVNRHIIKAIVSVAKEMDIPTLVEGVDSKEKFDFLKETGCDRAQGFYFYKPTPLDEILITESLLTGSQITEKMSKSGEQK